jgi:hypothetical protein
MLYFGNDETSPHKNKKKSCKSLIRNVHMRSTVIILRRWIQNCILEFPSNADDENTETVSFHSPAHLIFVFLNAGPTLHIYRHSEYWVSNNMLIGYYAVKKSLKAFTLLFLIRPAITLLGCAIYVFKMHYMSLVPKF